MKTPTHLLDPATFREWRENPVTVEFFQFLAGRVDRLQENWAMGVVGSASPEVQAQAVVLSRLLSLTCREVREEYGIETAENGNEED